MHTKLVLLTAAAIFALLGARTAYAEGQGGMGNLPNPLPAGDIYPTPVGILFPGFNVAAGVNAATLASGKRQTAAQVTGAPALRSGDSTTYLASLATSSNKLGWSIGYLGSSGTTMTHGIFAGVGFYLNPVSFGVGLRDTDIMSSGFDFSPNVDVGTKIEIGKDFAIGGVVYGLDGTMGASVGFGYGRKKKENIELNVLLPSLSGTDIAATFAATVYTGRFGTTFRTTYYITTQAFSHTLGGLIWFTSNVNLLVQLTSPSSLSAGLTWVF